MVVIGLPKPGFGFSSELGIGFDMLRRSSFETLLSFIIAGEEQKSDVCKKLGMMSQRAL